MHIPPASKKIIFIAAIFAVIWGGYNIAKASYVAIAWDKAEGVVIDIEQSTWSCAEDVMRCYELIVGFYAGGDNYTVNSNKVFNDNPPTHLMNEKIDVYYYPLTPAESVLGGSYGEKNYGITLFIIGLVVLFIFWLFRKSN